MLGGIRVNAARDLRRAAMAVGVIACLGLGTALPCAGQGRAKPSGAGSKHLHPAYHQEAGPNTRIAIKVGDKLARLDSITLTLASGAPITSRLKTTPRVELTSKVQHDLARLFGPGATMPSTVTVTVLQGPGNGATGWDYLIEQPHVLKIKAMGPVYAVYLRPVHFSLTKVNGVSSNMPKSAWTMNPPVHQ